MFRWESHRLSSREFKIKYNYFSASSVEICDWTFEDANLLKPFPELEDIPEVWSPPKNEFNLGETQNLIDEVEEFLNIHEDKNISNSNSENSSILEDFSFDLETSDLETSDLNTETTLAEDALDALIRGTIPVDQDYVINGDPMEVESPMVESNVIDTSNITNVSEFVLEDGRNVIIMIAGPAKDSGSGSNPTSPPIASDSSDSEWCPSPSSSTSSSLRRRMKAPKAALKSKKAAMLSVHDKKERKKWQNVEAARRYRDKKKMEQEECELEIKMLADKNKNLKDRFNSIQNEVLTLKKLMVDLGLIKTAN